MVWIGKLFFIKGRVSYIWVDLERALWGCMKIFEEGAVGVEVLL